MLTLAATIGAPLGAQAQTDVPPQPAASGMGGHHHGRHMRDPFIRAVHKLTLTDQQKAQIKSDIAATRQASENATPDQRKANWKQLHKQIEDLLTPTQLRQLQTELAAQKAERKTHKHAMESEPQPAPTST
jgi:Spy/CpxP family protein refolding chaperone